MNNILFYKCSVIYHWLIKCIFYYYHTGLHRESLGCKQDQTLQCTVNETIITTSLLKNGKIINTQLARAFIDWIQGMCIDQNKCFLYKDNITSWHASKGISNCTKYPFDLLQYVCVGGKYVLLLLEIIIFYYSSVVVFILSLF